MKKCTFCAEEIQDNAIKCKHCGSMLTQTEYTKINKSKNAKPTKNLLLLLVFIAFLFVVYQGFIFSRNYYVKKTLVSAAIEKLGYNDLAYKFSLKSYEESSLPTATLLVTEINSGISWDVSFINITGKWSLHGADSLGTRDLDEIESCLLNLARGRVDNGHVQYQKSEGDRCRELIRTYNLKRPNSPLPLVGS